MATDTDDMAPGLQHCPKFAGQRPEPRTAQDADNALLVRAMMEGHVACTERLGAIQRVVTMTNGEVFHVKLVNGDYLLTKSIRAALRRALGEEPA